MKLSAAIKKYKIENFNYKNHTFIFREYFCMICYRGLSKNRFDLLRDSLKQFIINGPDYCGNDHNYIRQYKCKKCNMYIEVADYNGSNIFNILY